MKPALSAAAALVLSATLAAQTAIKPPKNRYKPEDDVKLGREAAAEVRKQYPVIENGQINDYLARLGRELVAQAPPELNRPEFEYSFTPVNLKDINAFALPGGPMFVNRGMIDAAQTEGEVVGVMAHELATCCCATARPTRPRRRTLSSARWPARLPAPSSAGASASAVSPGQPVRRRHAAAKLQPRLREAGRPRSARRSWRGPATTRATWRGCSRRLSKQGQSSGGPEWLSNHPNPGNRSEYIAQEARPSRSRRTATAGATSRPPSRLRRAAGGALDGRARQARHRRQRRDSAGGGIATTGTPGQPVPAAVARTRTERGGSIFQVNVPDNWRTLSANSDIRYVPENAFGPMNGQNVLTHGVELGVARAASTDLMAATDTFIEALMQGEPTVRRAGESRVATIAAVAAWRRPSPTDRRSAATSASTGDRATGGREPVLRADRRPRAGRGGLRGDVREHPAVYSA